MSPLSKSVLLFSLNWLDAQLTILWMRLNIADEGNGIMSKLLSLGETPFLAVKLSIGAFTAYVLYRCAHLRLAQGGMWMVLTVYISLMIVHGATGFSALGWKAPGIVFAYFVSLPSAILALLS